jgi:hypothetical protein
MPSMSRYKAHLTRTNDRQSLRSVLTFVYDHAQERHSMSSSGGHEQPTHKPGRY